MVQTHQLLMSLNTGYYTKFAAENPRRILVSANVFGGKNMLSSNWSSHAGWRGGIRTTMRFVTILTTSAQARR